MIRAVFMSPGKPRQQSRYQHDHSAWVNDIISSVKLEVEERPGVPD